MKHIIKRKSVKRTPGIKLTLSKEFDASTVGEALWGEGKNKWDSYSLAERESLVISWEDLYGTEAKSLTDFNDFIAYDSAELINPEGIEKKEKTKRRVPTFVITEIDWDIDGDIDPDLPSKEKVIGFNLDLKWDGDGPSENEIEEALGNYLSDQHGYAVNSFQYEEKA